MILRERAGSSVSRTIDGVSVLQWLKRPADGISPRSVWWTCLSVIVVVAVIGIAARNGQFTRGAEHFLLDGEKNVPALWSAFLLVAAGFGVFRLARSESRVGVRLLGASLIFMAVDELMSLHELLERLTDTDWQTLYLPVFAVIGLSFVLVMRWLQTTCVRSAQIFTVGAGAWAVSQVLEKVQWDSVHDTQVSGYVWVMTAEEVLEMLGSLMFLVAALVAHRALSSRSDADSHNDPVRS